ncbi:MAG: 16S rRNA (cytosine(967)-C(5))-methyltransferase RsmB [Clostridia bacterium]|nr:16S rRNA (cytosine(967)-C(5))-methyltransferase RsmB [Clostridia bacterium]
MNARRTAFDVLIKSERSNQYSNIAVDRALEASDLAEKDRALAAAIIYGVTERRVTLDYYISRLSTRAVEDIDPDALCAVRMGLYQLIYMDRIPPHAAVNETVALCRKNLSGFVNALLRAYMRRGSEIELPSEENAPAEYLSAAYSVCPPLSEKLIAEFGYDRAKSILQSSFDTPRTTLRVNELRTDKGELMRNIKNAVPSDISSQGLKISGSVRNTFGFDTGMFFVQDEASQICVNAVSAKEGDVVIDACSCPGSKSFGMAIDMKNKGKIFSFDLHKSKLSLVRDGAKRLGIDIIETRVGDGRVFLPELEGAADKVLCDVPCSGYGVLAKKPELRYKNPAVSAALPDIQLAILSNCARYVRKGGTLVYSTCTILPEENEKNVKRFLAQNTDFRLEGFEYFGRECLSGTLSLYPDTDRTDGFFIAKMIKNG